MTNTNILTALLVSICFAGCLGGAETESQAVDVDVAADELDVTASQLAGFVARPHCATGPGIAWWVAQDGTLLESHYEGVEDPAFDDEMGPESIVPSDALPSGLRPASPRAALRPDPEPAVALEDVGELLQERSQRSSGHVAIATASTADGAATRTLLVHVPGTNVTVLALTTSRDLDLFRLVDEILQARQESVN